MKSTLYRSSIPSTAKERVIERYASGAKKMAEYRVGRKLVGQRLFVESGETELEYGMKDGKKHGREYDWIAPGALVSIEPFEDGLCHGVFKQFGRRGRLIGTYRMVHGTGIDLWRQQGEDDRAYLAEVLYYKNGDRHGFEWRIEENQRSVYIERHWSNGRPHGIDREWNKTGRLRRGYPKYYVKGEAVTRKQYLKAASADPTLPSFRSEDNDPERVFPTEIAKHLLR